MLFSDEREKLNKTYKGLQNCYLTFWMELKKISFDFIAQLGGIKVTRVTIKTIKQTHPDQQIQQTNERNFWGW